MGDLCWAYSYARGPSKQSEACDVAVCTMEMPRR